MITLICEIVLCADAFILLWAAYIWYLDRLWDWSDSRNRVEQRSWQDRLNQLETPTWVVVDRDDREIARFD